MKTYTVEELRKANHELLLKVDEAVRLYLPRIGKQVFESLEGGGDYVVAEHSTFVRMIETDHDEKLFVEVRTMHAKRGEHMVSTIWRIILHDTFEEYEAERIKLSERNFTTQYKGERLN